MDASLRAGVALIGLLLILAFLQSASRVALVNRQRGDWVTRRVGWLVQTKLRRLARKQQRDENVQDVLAWILPLYFLLVIIVWFEGTTETEFSNKPRAHRNRPTNRASKAENPVRNRWPRTGHLTFFETATSKFGQGG